MSTEQSIVSVARIRIERALAELDVAASELRTMSEHETAATDLHTWVVGVRAGILAHLQPAPPTCTDPAADGEMRPRQPPGNDGVTE